MREKHSKIISYNKNINKRTLWGFIRKSNTNNIIVYDDVYFTYFDYFFILKRVCICYTKNIYFISCVYGVLMMT